MYVATLMGTVGKIVRNMGLYSEVCAALVSSSHTLMPRCSSLCRLSPFCSDVWSCMSPTTTPIAATSGRPCSSLPICTPKMSDTGELQRDIKWWITFLHSLPGFVIISLMALHFTWSAAESFYKQSLEVFEVSCGEESEQALKVGILFARTTFVRNPILFSWHASVHNARMCFTTNKDFRGLVLVSLIKRDMHGLVPQSCVNLTPFLVQNTCSCVSGLRGMWLAFSEAKLCIFLWKMTFCCKASLNCRPLSLAVGTRSVVCTVLKDGEVSSLVAVNGWSVPCSWLFAGMNCWIRSPPECLPSWRKERRWNRQSVTQIGRTIPMDKFTA